MDIDKIIDTLIGNKDDKKVEIFSVFCQTNCGIYTMTILWIK